MARRGNMMISFLDVLCSAMGGMVILAVLFSIVKNPVQQPPIDDAFILVVFDVQGGEHQLGVVVTAPDRETQAVWRGTETAPKDILRRQAPGGVRFWSGQTLDGTASQLYLEVRDPVGGGWRFQPYMVDWSTGQERARLIKTSLWTHRGRHQANAGGHAGGSREIRSPGHLLNGVAMTVGSSGF